MTEFLISITTVLVCLLIGVIFFENQWKAVKEELNLYKELNKELETDYKKFVEEAKVNSGLFKELFPNGVTPKHDVRHKLNHVEIRKAFESKDFDLLKDFFIALLFRYDMDGQVLEAISDEIISKNIIISHYSSDKKQLLKQMVDQMTELGRRDNALYKANQTIEHFKKLHPRAMRLLEVEKHFIVVTWDEPYFEQVYSLIKEHELEKGNWHEDDEKDYQKWIRRNQELIPRETHA